MKKFECAVSVSYFYPKELFFTEDIFVCNIQNVRYYENVKHIVNVLCCVSLNAFSSLLFPNNILLLLSASASSPFLLLLIPLLDK